jgi:hypothetical protein
LAAFAVHRADAQPLPQLGQGAQHGRFGELAAQRGPRLVGGQRPFLFQQLPQFQHQGRNLMP